MLPGTPGFVGERLKEAREARELSGTALAGLLGVTPPSISQYENGKQTPAPQVMRRISTTLNLPYHFFLAPISPPESDVLFYRSLESATKMIRSKMERRFGWLRELVAYLRRFVQFPIVKFPEFDLPSDPAHLSFERIEEIARNVRREWGLADNPISNLVWLMENHGAIVSRQHLGSDSLDAFSQWNTSEATPYFVLGSDKASAVRSRYNVAHELGHLILHRKVSKETMQNKVSFQLIEKQANRFAGAFILPAETFSGDFLTGPTLDRFVSLKPKWKASIAFMAKRCEDLEIVNKDQMRRLMINLTQRGWRRCEPFDDTMEFEQPRVLRRSIELLVGKGVVAPSEISFRTRLADRDIEELAGLEDGFFAGQSADPSDEIKFNQVGIDAIDEARSRGDIIRFPKAQ